MSAPMALKLTKGTTTYLVSTMVLTAEMGQLPLLLMLTEREQGNTAPPEPKVGDGPYTLKMEKDGVSLTPFGVSQWFIQSVTHLTLAQHESAFCIRLGALPGQHLPMKGYAVDGSPMSEVLKAVSDRFGASRRVENNFITHDPSMGTVVSFNETMAQFLGRMATAANTWLWAQDQGNATLSLQWQTQLQGREANKAFELTDWLATCIATERTAAVQAVRTFWPRSRNTLAEVAHENSADLFTREVLNLLPTPTTNADEKKPITSPWEIDYHLSDKLNHAWVWPGLNTGEERVVLGVIHMYDQSAGGDVRQQLGQLVPGIRPNTTLPTLDNDAAYGVFAISTPSGQGYDGAAGALARQRLANKADRLGAVLGIPLQAKSESQAPSPRVVLATACPWDAEKNKDWTGGSGGEGNAAHTTHIKVQFDWSDVPVRVPHAAAISGAKGEMYFPPGVGDRLLVLLEDLWPVAALGAVEKEDVELPTLLSHEGDINTLSAPRGVVVKGGLIFRTDDQGDVIIHAAGNLVLKAEKEVYLQGEHIHNRGIPTNK